MASKSPQGKSPLGKQNNGLYFGIFLLLALVVGMVLFIGFGEGTKALSYSEFLKYVENGKVSSVTITGQTITGFYNPDGTTAQFDTIIPLSDDSLLPNLISNDVTVIGDVESNSIWLIYGGLFFVLILFMIFGMMRGAQSGGGPGQSAMNFGKSKARLHKEVIKKVTFKDVAGCEEAKEDLQEVVEFLKSPQKFTALGARIPKGVLLVGPPGTGKTLLAKAVAGEANVPFFSVSGSEFVEMFVGVGASRVRDLFTQGRKNAPCIIFVDEIDAVGRSRGAGLGGSHDEREQTLNQILVEMDGFDSAEGLILVAATNRPDILDPALLRPGRFDRQIVVDSPDVKAREMILKVHTRKVPLAEDVNLKTIAKATPGLTGADLENLVNEAALKAARENRKKADHEDFEFAREKVQMGPERRSKVVIEEDKIITAYHEAGHAVLSHFLPHSDPVHKVTIIPRGFAGGYMMPLPQDERTHWFREKLIEKIMVAFGGRCAEELIFSRDWISTGASQDIAQASKIARSMVCKWGMSEELGPIQYGEENGPVFLGRDMMTQKNYSSKYQALIDSEVEKIVKEGFDKAYAMLKKYQDKLVVLAETLLERETLNGDEVMEILGEPAKVRFPILKVMGREGKIPLPKPGES